MIFKRFPFKTLTSFLDDLVRDVAGRHGVRHYLRRIFYWCAHRMWDRYDYCWTGEAPGYSDVCERMLKVNFQLLCDFVELERPDEIIDWDHDEAHQKIWAEIRTIYLWWTKERPARHDPYDDVEPPRIESVQLSPEELEEMGMAPDVILFEMRTIASEEEIAEHRKALNESMDLETQWSAEDTDMLCRLMKVRSYLWT